MTNQGPEWGHPQIALPPDWPAAEAGPAHCIQQNCELLLTTFCGPKFSSRIEQVHLTWLLLPIHLHSQAVASPQVTLYHHWHLSSGEWCLSMYAELGWVAPLGTKPGLTSASDRTNTLFSIFLRDVRLAMLHPFILATCSDRFENGPEFYVEANAPYWQLFLLLARTISPCCARQRSH